MAMDRTVFSSDDDEDRIFGERMASHQRMYGEDSGEKIGREVYVMAGGTFDAARAAFSKEHLAETGLTAAGSAAAGFAFRAAEARLPGMRPLMAVAGTALTVSFVRDLLGRGAEVGEILSDTWAHKEHDEQNRKAFAEHGGKFAFDLALSTTAGFGGSALANKALFGAGSNFTRIAAYDQIGLRGKKSTPEMRLFSKDDPLAQLYEQAAPSALKFRATRNSGPRANTVFSGNAFVISEDGLAVTNHHCIDRKDAMAVTDYLGVTHKARVIAASKIDDVAILQLEKGDPATIFKPLRLASENARPGDEVVAFSHHRSNSSLAMAPGRVRDFQTIPVSPELMPLGYVSKTLLTVHPFTRKLMPEPVPNSGLMDSERMLASYFSKSGASGSAVLNTSGEVVGVHSGNLGKFFSQLTARNDAVPVSAISKLLNQAVARRY
ncbi:MAG: trypsin-like peptidase domain-containing protein [Cyanobacteria bacterium SZAS TMP-1]|nr:trypsin-like peptidase domain-containing protein [Cyanobacteria bacterium SZAS TMP-1]